MTSLFFSPEIAPFALALGLLAGLLVLELVFLLMGATLFGADGAEADIDGLEFDAEPFDLDIEPGVDLESALDLDFTAYEAELGDYDMPAFEADPVTEGAPTPPDPTGPLAWLGIGKAPFILWLAALLLGFGVSGLVLVNLVGNFGLTLPRVASIPLATLAGGWFVGRFGQVFARALPKTETTALSRSRLARRKGVVSQGTARRGKPAEVRVTDFYGNIHYLRGEPMADEAEIAQGSEVLVLRHRPTGGYRLIAFTG